MSDKNVESVRERLLLRAKTGIKKYGVTTERQDLTETDWLRHAQEEALDLAVYLERLIRDREPQWKDAPDAAGFWWWWKEGVGMDGPEFVVLHDPTEPDRNGGRWLPVVRPQPPKG